MSLPHALLTSLLERESSGLDLANRFDKSIGYFWPSSHQQIYRELGRLEEAGWVESVAAAGARGRKRLYRVLPAGQAELQRWLGESQDPHPIRDALMVRIRAEAVLGGGLLAHDLRHRLSLHRQKLDLYRQIEQRDFAGMDLPRAKRLQHLVLKAGIAQETYGMAFCEQALTLLAE